MAVIHRTTMNPTKTELLAGWLPTQPWYRGGSRAAAPAPVGGFRLDDPEGQVGIEFIVATDTSAGEAVTYLLPLTYRGAPLDDAGRALIGTSEHGVLGRRWIYDGTHDPVLVTRLLALMTGDAVPQAQHESNTPDGSVTGHFAGPGQGPLTDIVSVTSGSHGTDIVIGTGPTPAEARMHLGIKRVLRPLPDGLPAHGPHPLGHVTAPWLEADGTSVRGLFAVADSACS
ncbi:1,4-alpha-glucan branching protein [Streptomyces sp. NPDC051018]|uniref:maltokinase N-terminal cap-like domain-containing protein n=1 Tax=Streptomyces sp. NPDC051018 TaxID=3365639 RepID=UPI0037B75243